MRQFYVYLLSSRSRRLYIGVTNNLERRIYEHKHKLTPGFTSKYNIDRLVHFECFETPETAIERVKELKPWLRAKKIALIEATNPTWRDLSEDWHTRE
ncbi:MAG: GIY-YIG nuclease family protein [Anaerolineae bacterium]